MPVGSWAATSEFAITPRAGDCRGVWASGEIVALAKWVAVVRIEVENGDCGVAVAESVGASSRPQDVIGRGAVDLSDERHC